MIGKNQGVGQGSTEKTPGRLGSDPISTVPDACLSEISEQEPKSIDCGTGITIDHAGSFHAGTIGVSVVSRRLFPLSTHRDP